MPKKEKGRSDWARIKFLVLLLLVIFLIGFYLYFSIKGYDMTETIKQFVADYEHLAPLIFIGLFVVSSFFPLPLLTIFGAALFPFAEVFIYSLIGNLINATIVFYIARWLGRDFVRYFEVKHETVREIDIGLRKNALKDTILLRFFYILPAEAINIASGLSSMRFRDYFLGSIIGLIPMLFASILIVKAKMMNNMTWMFISVLLLAVLLVVPLIYIAAARKFAHKKIKHLHRFVKRI